MTQTLPFIHMLKGLNSVIPFISILWTVWKNFSFYSSLEQGGQEVTCNEGECIAYLVTLLYRHSVLQNQKAPYNFPERTIFKKYLDRTHKTSVGWMWSEDTDFHTFTFGMWKHRSRPCLYQVVKWLWLKCSKMQACAFCHCLWGEQSFRNVLVEACGKNSLSITFFSGAGWGGGCNLRIKDTKNTENLTLMSASSLVNVRLTPPVSLCLGVSSVSPNGASAMCRQKQLPATDTALFCLFCFNYQ